jgi:hypothetical protein
MSETEQLWNALCKHYEDDRSWNQLTPQQQQVFLQGINCFLAVIHKLV